MFNFFKRKKKNNDNNDNTIVDFISVLHPSVQEAFNQDSFKAYSKGIGNPIEVVLFLILLSRICYMNDQIKELKELIASKND